MARYRAMAVAMAVGMVLASHVQAGGEGMKVTLKPYHFEGKLLVEADTSGTKVRDKRGHKLKVAIRDPAGERVAAQGVIERSGKHRYTRGHVSLEGVAAGVYEVAVTLRSSRGRVLAGPVTLPLRIPERPEWYGSRAGISDEVLPPWTPLEVDGTTVKCWGREYRFTDSPFPSQIVSAGEEMLAEPISIKPSRNVALMEWRDARVSVIERNPHRVVLRSEADSELLSLNALTTIEYDGMVKVDCTFKPKRTVRVDGMTVMIPLKQERALYFNSPWATRYGNALEYKGQIDREGWEWKHEFVPSLNLRDDERGLDWACESDAGWKPYGRRHRLRVRRKGDRVTLEVRVLGRTTLRKALKVSMMLQATPVRAFPQGYRKLNIIHFEGGPVKDGLTWEIPDVGRTAYPIRGIKKASEMGARTLVFHELWSNGFGRPIPYRPAEFKRVVEYAHGLGMNVLVYYGSGFWADSPEYKAYQWDWDALPREDEVEGAKQAAPGRKDMMYIGLCPSGGQYLNYVAHGLERLVEEYDVDGIYMDGGEAFPCANLGHGCGHAAGARGTERPTWKVLACRELRRRLYTVLHESGKDVLIDQHMPYGQTAPIHSFTTTYLAGEPLAHHLSAEHRIPLAWMRQEFTGLQFGAPAEILVYRNQLIHKYMASALIHGTYLRILCSDYIYLQGADLVDWMSKVWKIAEEFGIEGATWLPYWQNADVVRVSPDAAKVSLYRRPDKGVLLFIGNTGTENAEVKIELDLNALGLPMEGLKVADAMSKKPMSLKGNVLSFEMKAETFRAVWIKGGEGE